MSISSLALVALLSLSMSLFRPKGLRYRSFLAGVVMGIVPLVFWALRAPNGPEEILMLLVAAFLTANGNAWGADVRAPLMVQAETIEYTPQKTKVRHFLSTR